MSHQTINATGMDERPRGATGRDESARVALSEGFHYRRDEPKKIALGGGNYPRGFVTYTHCFRHLAPAVATRACAASSCTAPTASAQKGGLDQFMGPHG